MVVAEIRHRCRVQLRRVLRYRCKAEFSCEVLRVWLDTSDAWLGCSMEMKTGVTIAVEFRLHRHHRRRTGFSCEGLFMIISGAVSWGSCKRVTASCERLS